MADQQFCLRWNNFQSNIVSSFETLLSREEFVDVTLTAEGKSLKAHRVLLSACSPYFRDLFRDLPPHQHPVIVLRDTSYLELKSLLSFMYHGEVNVSQERLGLLLKTAESLRIKGLAQDRRTSEPELFGSLNTASPNGDEAQEKEPRGATGGGAGGGSPVPMGYSPMPPGLHMPPSSLLVPLEPPSHKQPPLTGHTSPPVKKRKSLHSPHSVQTPPSREPPAQLQATPPPSLPSGPPPDEDSSSRVMNLTLSTPNAPASESPPSPKIVPKVEVGEEDSLGVGGPPAMGAEGETSSDLEGDEGHPPPPEEDYKDQKFLSASQELAGLGPHLTAAVQNVVPYATVTAGSSQLDSFPGPSVLPLASQAGWRHAETTDTSSQGSHPVFNELLCAGDGSYGGKKAVPTPCPVCGKVLSNAYNMRVHLETHQDITYKCIICGIITRTRDTMRKHLSNVHKLRNIELKNSFKKITGKSSMSTSPNRLSVTPPKMGVARAHSKGACSRPKGVKVSPKKEPSWSPSTFLAGPESSSEALNLVKGNSLASIVSKLTSQKQ